MARGEMVRFMAERGIENPADIQEFNRLGYRFREDLSSEKEYIFERLSALWEFKTVTKADMEFIRPKLQNKYSDFQAAGCESTDSHFVHKAWHDSSERICKIMEPTHALCKDFEVLIESDGMAERGSFIVNPEGKIVVYEVNAGNVGRNADELFRRLQASQFVAEHGDQVCPAKWQPGAETLKPSLDLVGML